MKSHELAVKLLKLKNRPVVIVESVGGPYTRDFEIHPGGGPWEDHLGYVRIEISQERPPEHPAVDRSALCKQSPTKEDWAYREFGKSTTNAPAVKRSRLVNPGCYRVEFTDKDIQLAPTHEGDKSKNAVTLVSALARAVRFRVEGTSMDGVVFIPIDREHKAVQHSDQRVCSCGVVWDMNDPHPPETCVVPK